MNLSKMKAKVMSFEWEILKNKKEEQDYKKILKKKIGREKKDKRKDLNQLIQWPSKLPLQPSYLHSYSHFATPYKRWV